VFVSRGILEWIAQAGIRASFSDPVKPWQNGTDPWHHQIQVFCAQIWQWRNDFYESEFGY
jgi:hypothetical protein